MLDEHGELKRRIVKAPVEAMEKEAEKIIVHILGRPEGACSYTKL